MPDRKPTFSDDTPASFDDPPLKAAVQRIYGSHRASDRLREAVVRRIREEADKPQVKFMQIDGLPQRIARQ